MQDGPQPLDEPRISDDQTRSFAQTLFVVVAWVIGLASTIYLVGNALYLLGLAVIFGFNAPPTPVLGYLAFVGENAIPTIFFAAIGIAGLKFLPSKRFWAWGLLAVLVETALAIYMYLDPEAMLTFADLPSKVLYWATSKKMSH